jgi:hypothetical protein
MVFCLWGLVGYFVGWELFFGLLGLCMLCICFGGVWGEV